jgi:hypothetical protein
LPRRAPGPSRPQPPLGDCRRPCSQPSISRHMQRTQKSAPLLLSANLGHATYASQVWDTVAGRGTATRAPHPGQCRDPRAHSCCCSSVGLRATRCTVLALIALTFRRTSRLQGMVRDVSGRGAARSVDQTAVQTLLVLLV